METPQPQLSLYQQPPPRTPDDDSSEGYTEQELKLDLIQSQVTTHHTDRVGTISCSGFFANDISPITLGLNPFIYEASDSSSSIEEEEFKEVEVTIVTEEEQTSMVIKEIQMFHRLSISHRFEDSSKFTSPQKGKSYLGMNIMTDKQDSDDSMDSPKLNFNTICWQVQLQLGNMFLKHHKWGSPKLRFVFVSMNKIIWKDMKKQKKKGFLLVEQITEIRKGQVRSRKVKDPKRLGNTFTIVTQLRTLELEAPSMEQKMRWMGHFENLLESVQLKKQ